jgi:hypothetical protein
MSFEIRFSTFMSGEFYYVFVWRFILTNYFCVGLMKGFPMVHNDLLVKITYGINSISSMNNRSDSNTF